MITWTINDIVNISGEAQEPYSRTERAGAIALFVHTADSNSGRVPMGSRPEHRASGTVTFCEALKPHV